MRKKNQNINYDQLKYSTVMISNIRQTSDPAKGGLNKRLISQLLDPNT